MLCINCCKPLSSKDYDTFILQAQERESSYYYRLTIRIIVSRKFQPFSNTFSHDSELERDDRMKLMTTIDIIKQTLHVVKTKIKVYHALQLLLHLQ